MTTLAATQQQSVDPFAAKLVGRYLSGAPLEGADDATEDPGSTNPDAVLEKSKINAFACLTDPDGIQVPRAAHIRAAHPRAQEPPGEHEGRRRRILRRDFRFAESFDPDSRPDSPFGADPQFPTTGVSASSPTNSRSATAPSGVAWQLQESPYGVPIAVCEPSQSTRTGLLIGQSGNLALPLIGIEASPSTQAGICQRVLSNKIEPGEIPQTHRLVVTGAGHDAIRADCY